MIRPIAEIKVTAPQFSCAAFDSWPETVKLLASFCLFSSRESASLSVSLFLKDHYRISVEIEKRRGLFDNVATVCFSGAASGEGPGLEAAECAEQVWCDQGADADAEADDGDD